MQDSIGQHQYSDNAKGHWSTQTATLLAMSTCLEKSLPILQHKWKEDFQHIAPKQFALGMTTVEHSRDLKTYDFHTIEGQGHSTGGYSWSHENFIYDTFTSFKQDRVQETVASL